MMLSLLLHFPANPEPFTHAGTGSNPFILITVPHIIGRLSLDNLLELYMGKVPRWQEGA